MDIDISVKIGGEAGQGIQTVGDLLALVCHRAGLHVMVINEFESRIRGGESFLQMRICKQPVGAPHHQVHLLVALNPRSYELYRDELAEGGLVMLDQKASEQKPGQLSLPLVELAKAAGGKITANTVAAGACLSLLGAPLELYQSVLKAHFGKRGETVLEQNLSAAQLGFEAAQETRFPWAFSWEPGEPKGRLLTGAQSLALGALAGDCRFGAFYPMSPATGIMAQLIAYKEQGGFPVVVEQAEDEIAAVNMIVGAAFAGVRSMTATSGGGFCLMAEGLGLAAISETPIVIVNSQRPGPATGLPTRTAQADLRFVIHASQDEFPRFVFAPATPNQAYTDMIRALDLSDKYQVPAIVLTDKYFNDTLFMADTPLKAPQTVNRYIATDADLEDPADYKRFAVTPTGVSPRALPCAGKALVGATGNEHREDGHISEAIADRVKMCEKRMAKLPDMLAEMNGPEAIYDGAETLLVGWGSTRGALWEAVETLRGEALDVGGVLFTDIWPFPVKAAINALSRAKRFFMVEGNTTAQLGMLIREQTGLEYAGVVLKYDGRPFYPVHIVEKIRELMR